MDESKFNELWAAYTPRLYGFLMNTVRDPTLADDLLQQTWIKAFTALPRYRHQGPPFSAWLFAIARNECRQHWRQANRETLLEPEHDIPDDRHTTDPDCLLVEIMLKTLTDDDHEIVRLRYLADLPIADIARVLHITAITARVRLHRALRRLKQHYEKTT